MLTPMEAGGIAGASPGVQASMRLLWLLGPLLVTATVGCRSRSDGAPSPPSAPPSSTPTRTSATPAVPPPGPTASSNERHRLPGLLAKGRRHADAGRWADAVRAFEAAVAIAPEDARAESELGWAAFNAGDLAKARRATDAALASAEGDPTLRAQSLYNAGRIAEASGDTRAAERAYRASLALRPSDVVERRLADLGATATASLEPPLGTSCLKARSVAEACACLEAESPGERCAPRKEPRLAGTNLLVLARGEVSYVAAQVEGGVLFAAALPRDARVVIDPVRRAGDERVVVFHATSSGDGDAGADAGGEAERTTAIFCVVDRASRPCPLAIPTSIRRGDARTRLDTTLRSDGTVDVVLREGTASDVPRGVLGARSLR